MEKEKLSSSGLPKAVNNIISPETLSSFRIEEDVTPEHLDRIIKNPKENPIMRQKALLTKQQLFGDKQKEVVPESIIDLPKIEEDELPSTIIPIIPPTKHVEEKNFQIKQLNDEAFGSMINSLKGQIYHQKVQLLSDPNKYVDLRCMTIKEYKFLTRQMVIYDQSIETIDKKSETYEIDIQKRESQIISAIDNVLQRCITNDVSVLDITHFDWIYLATILRLISKGDETAYTVKCDKKGCNVKIPINVSKLIDSMKNNVNEFIKNPLGKLPFKDNELYISLPTRGDRLFAEKESFNDRESSLNILNTAMYIRALIIDDTAYMLNNKQRVELLNIIDEPKTLSKLDKIINDNTKSFYKLFDTFRCPTCEKEVKITFSDFIIFFFEF